MRNAANLVRQVGGGGGGGGGGSAGNSASDCLAVHVCQVNVGVAYPRYGRSFIPIHVHVHVARSRDRTILLAFRLLQYCDRVHEVKPCSAERASWATANLSTGSS